MKILALGSNAAVPAHDRHLSAQVLHYANTYYLIDCGEGTQFQLLKSGISVHKIDRIFISHVHGDHIFGLPGLITSMSLQNRKHDLYIYCAKAVKEFVQQALNFTQSRISFTIYFAELPNETCTLYENEGINVSAFPLLHGVPCVGFLFKEKAKPRNIRKDKLVKYGFSLEQIHRLKAGDNLILENGTILKNDEVTYADEESLSYGYCTDTKFNAEIVPVINNITCLYHEATFAETEKDKCDATFHSSTKQAAEIARLAKVKHLLIGHFSSRYKNTKLLENEAREIFSKTDSIQENQWYDLSTL